MADDQDVFDAQHFDRVVNHRQRVEVGMHDDVADIAMDEDLARRQADDLVRRNAAVRAADPQVLGRLLVDQPREKIGILRVHALGPGLVVGKKVFEWFFLTWDSYRVRRREQPTTFARGPNGGPLK